MENGKWRMKNAKWEVEAKKSEWGFVFLTSYLLLSTSSCSRVNPVEG